MTLSCQKHLFSLAPGVHYLNGAAYSPSLRVAVEKGMEGLRLKAETPFLISPQHHFDTADRVRRLFSDLVGAGDPERIALIPAVSYGMAVVAQNLHRLPGISAKNRIVLIGEEFPNNVYAFERVSAVLGLAVHTVDKPASFENRGAKWNDRLLEAITAETALVVASPVHWIYGTLFDMEAIGRRCREMGALLAIDATQSVGARPFDVQAVRPDALICAAYKWLLGPYGTGAAYFGPFFDDGVPVEESWMNRMESDQFARLTRYERAYRPKAQRYNAGEFSQFIQLPMLEASLSQLHAWDTAQIVGGGARGHDKIHPFDVKALKADHPVMKDIPASFTVEDELYYVNAEGTPEGTAAIEVLAETSNSDKYQKPHPSVWITKHPKAKIVGLALGHDARVHDLKPYQQLLINAAKWTSGK